MHVERDSHFIFGFTAPRVLACIVVSLAYFSSLLWPAFSPQASVIPQTFSTLPIYGILSRFVQTHALSRAIYSASPFHLIWLYIERRITICASFIDGASIPSGVFAFPGTVHSHPYLG
jgi:hypothetical protein